jgi:hypothetical protein
LKLFKFETCSFLNKSYNDFLKKNIGVDRKLAGPSGTTQAGPAAYPGAGGSKKKGLAAGARMSASTQTRKGIGHPWPFDLTRIRRLSTVFSI